MPRAFFYDADGKDCEVELDAAALKRAGDRQLLWIDIERENDADLDFVGDLLKLSNEARAAIRDPRAAPPLVNYGTHVQLSVPAPPQEGSSRIARLDFLISERWLLSVRDEDIEFLRAFRDQDRAESMKGELSPAIVAASLLDWHLESYFEAVGEVEAAIDELDSGILGGPADEAALDQLAAMRRRVALLRGRISEQRPVFHGLVRPDFSPIAKSDASDHFRDLVARFDHAIDAVERARDVVVGSFDLFATKTALETNKLVKALTFVTVLIGFAAAVAGLFGMNFETPFFKTGEHGFLTVLAALAIMSVLAALLARRYKWI